MSHPTDIGCQLHNLSNILKRRLEHSKAFSSWMIRLHGITDGSLRFLQTIKIRIFFRRISKMPSASGVPQFLRLSASWKKKGLLNANL